MTAGGKVRDTDGGPDRLARVFDMGAQVAAAADNLEAVLAGAGMRLADVIKLTIYVTDMDAYRQNAGVLPARTRTAGNTPPTTLIGVARLAYPELMIEIEATAAD